MNRYELGRRGEDFACGYLEEHGFTVIGRNVHAGHSEFDIICTDGKYIVFAEIKTRNEAPDSPDRYGRPANAVTAKKADALIRGAQRYLREENITGLQPRIDVIEIYADCFPKFHVLKLHHIRNAVVRSEKTENANRR